MLQKDLITKTMLRALLFVHNDCYISLYFFITPVFLITIKRRFYKTILSRKSRINAK